MLGPKHASFLALFRFLAKRHVVEANFGCFAVAATAAAAAAVATEPAAIVAVAV